MDGSAAAHPITAPESAALVVVGNKHRSALGSIAATSVSFPVAAHAPLPCCPGPRSRRVLRRRQGAGRGVVVGVDGSHAASQALAIAAQTAARTGEPLTIVSAWDIPATRAWTNAALAAGGNDLSWCEAMRDNAADTLRRAAASVHDLHPDLAVSTQVVQGSPAARAVTEAGGKAALVVVGWRGRGGFASLVLGSVSHAVMHDCTAPVMVVR